MDLCDEKVIPSRCRCAVPGNRGQRTQKRNLTMVGGRTADMAGSPEAKEKVMTMRHITICITVFMLTMAVQPAAAQTVTLQCGEATITLEKKKNPDGGFGWQAIKSTGLPYGVFSMTVKDDVTYIGGKPCKQVCEAPAEQRC
jgi:hypothetical protein